MKHFFVFFLFTLSSALAQPDKYHELALAGIAQGHNVQIDRAEETFNEMIALEPGHPLGYLAQGLIYLYRYRFEENQPAFEKKFKDYTNQAIKLSKKNLSKQEKRVEALFYLGIANLFWGFYHSEQDNWVKAFWYGKQGLDDLNKVVAIDSSYYDAYLGLGMYHYYADFMANFLLKTVSSVLGFDEGDRKKGLRELQLAAEKGVYTRTLAAFLLGDIYSNAEGEYEKALICFNALAQQYPDNPFYLLYQAEALQNTGNHSQAIEMATRVVHEKNHHRNPRFGILSYFRLGSLCFELNQFDAADAHYRQALAIASQSPGNMKWVAWANYLSGRCHEMLGKREEAIGYYQKVKKSDEKHVYESAQQLVKQPPLPVDLELLRGRNYAKTKNHAKALAVLEAARAKAVENTEDFPERKIAEIQYCIAKTQYDAKAFADAVVEFKKIFAIKKIEAKWLEPMAHLHLGHCYMEMGEAQKAEAEYEIASQYEDGALRFEIDKMRERQGGKLLEKSKS